MFIFDPSRPIHEILETVDKSQRTMLYGFFATNAKEHVTPLSQSELESKSIGGKPARPSCELLLAEFPEHFTWSKQNNTWKRREKEMGTIGRMLAIHPSCGELYYLRILLCHVRGPTSFVDIRTVNGQELRDYKETCIEMGLLEDDREWDRCLCEAEHDQIPRQLRNLFATILIQCDPMYPARLWNKHKLKMCEDIMYSQGSPELTAPIEVEALRLIQLHLTPFGRTLADYHIIIPEIRESDMIHHRPRRNRRQQLLDDYTDYDHAKLQQNLDATLQIMTSEQRHIFDIVTTSATGQSEPQLFFIDALAGSGKTTVLNAIINAIRLQNRIVMAMASTALASQLLEDATTAHRGMKVRVEV
jgi:hypothetical protein